jgi:FkbM family methyltransferase
MRFETLKNSFRKRFPQAFAVVRRVYRFPQDHWKPASGCIYQSVEEFCQRNDGNITFVQVGANNGDDEFAAIRRRFGWHGVMIEPQRRVFDELCRKHQSDTIRCECVAIGRESGEATLYQIAFSSAEWATTLAGFDKRVIEKHIDDGWVARCAAQEGVPLPSRREDYYKQETIQCMPLADLFQKHCLRTVDLLLIDTEGYDFEVLKQVPTLPDLPRVIIYEHKHLPIADQKAAVRFLRSLGYELVGESANTLALRRNLPR